MNDIAHLLADLHSGEDARCERAVRGLSRHGEAALDALTAALKDPSPDHRWWAVRALAELDTPIAEGRLIAALGDPEASVRQCAALALRQRSTPAALPALTAALDDPDRLVARLAGDALAAAGETAILALQGALAQQAPGVRIEAIRALALMKHERAVPLLFSVLDDPSSMVSYWAEEGLERLGIGMVFFNP